MNLASILMKLSHEKLTVELKDKSVIQGTMVGCDLRMNMHFKFARVKSPQGKMKKLDSISIRGSTIRYVFLPPALDLDSILFDDSTSVVTSTGFSAPSSS